MDRAPRSSHSDDSPMAEGFCSWSSGVVASSAAPASKSNASCTASQAKFDVLRGCHCLLCAVAGNKQTQQSSVEDLAVVYCRGLQGDGGRGRLRQKPPGGRGRRRRPGQADGRALGPLAAWRLALSCSPFFHFLQSHTHSEALVHYVRQHLCGVPFTHQGNLLIAVCFNY